MKKKCFEAKYIFPIIICSVLTFFVLWDVGWSIGLHALMKGYDLPEEAEILLRPKIRHICCVDGNRTNIEMVYRMPEEYIDQVEFGYQAKKGYAIEVEPLDYENSNIEYELFEHDCTYVYDAIYPQQYDFYSEDDGNCYVHVTMWVSHSGNSYDNILTFPLYFIIF